MWRESGLSWSDFLSEGEDVQAFISQQVANETSRIDSVNPRGPSSPHSLSSLPLKQKLQLILSDGSSPEAVQSKRILSPDELSQQLERLLLEDMATDEQIFDWVEVGPAARRLGSLRSDSLGARIETL